MTPAPTGRTGDGYPGRGVPPRPDRPQGPPRSRDVPRPRPPQDPRQGPPAEPTPWDDYSNPQAPQAAQAPQYPQRPQARDPRGGQQRDPRDPRDPGRPRAPRDPRDPSQQPRPDLQQGGYPQPGYPPQAGRPQAGYAQQPPSYQQSPSFQRVDRATQEMRTAEETHVPRGTRRRVPQNPEDLRPAGVPGPRPQPNGYSQGPDQDEFSSSFQEGYAGYDGDDGPETDDPDALDGERGGRGRRRAGSRRKDRLSPAQRRRRKTIFRSVAAVLAVFVFMTSYSLYGALSAPGNMSNQARVAEWARGHGMGWAVTWMENQQYQNNKPKTGGNLSPQQLADLAPPSATPTLAKNEHVLPPMKPFVPNPAPGEGDWSPAVVVNGVPVIQTAKLRSDPQHLEYLSAVSWMDQKHASFVLHPGSQQPGTAGYNQTDHLAGDQLKNLIATWNGAFLLNPNDAHGGFYLNGKTYGTLVPGQASEVFYKDGTMNVGSWNSGPGLQMDPNVVGVRQNLQLLVDNGQVNPSVDSDDKKLWGVTVKNAYFVWRSGIGVTADGNVVYAIGPALSVRTLAELLQRAGAVRGMELDINQEWVSYMTYAANPNGTGDPTSTKLLDFARTGQRYFSTEERDFVAVYSR
ncbi:hypothetical protein ABH920_007086 [Catenulispora sp. EB89]|uniref:phosphodiester glycosidase family protein n=1 Tax=Catenulispora sp. EB89 TaxID=3156257 RepID=UPI00351210FF